MDSPFADDDMWERQRIRVSTNEANPSRGLTGFATTFTALSVDSTQITASDFGRHGYILVEDECHHVASQSPFHRGIQPLRDRCRLHVMMSGDLDRGDKKPIAGLEEFYVRGDDGRLTLRLCDTDDTRIIQYGRVDALKERQILPLHFEHLDGAARWIDSNGFEHSVESLASLDEDSGSGLFAAMHTPYAMALLDECIADWKIKKDANPRSKLLVIAPTIALAKKYLAYVHSLGLKAKIATNDDSDAARKAIRQFKMVGTQGVIDILVTVAMAYEGLDVPPVTHLACLTHIRSVPWIKQMFARAIRVDHGAGPYESQVAVAFLPDDPAMREVIALIRSEQAAVVNSIDVPAPPPGDPTSPPPPPRSDEDRIIPLEGRVTDVRASDLHTGEEVDPVETRILGDAIKAERLPISIMQLRRALRAIETMKSAPRGPDDPAPMTPSQEEQAMRDELQRFCSENDRLQGWDHGATNVMVKRQFGKGRPEMTLDELRRVFGWLNEQFPRGAA